MSDRRETSRQRGQRAANDKLDNPKNSRLFVIASKAHTDEVLRDHFSQFTGLEDIWLVTDRSTGEKKGVAYVKFTKASLAARAMEETDGKVVGGIGRSVKVKVAQSRESGSTRDFDEDEELTRVFVVTPKTFSESDIREKFEEFGTISKVHRLTTKGTNEYKGLAYVKFHKMSEAALAIEEADPEFKTVWAEPKRNTENKDQHRKNANGSRRRSDSWDRGRDSDYDRGYERDYRGRDNDYDSYEYSWGQPARPEYPPQSFLPSSRGFDEVTSEVSSGALPVNATARLQVDVTGKTTEQQLHALFNIVPGMEYCDFRQEQNSWGFRGTAHVRYKSQVFAAYARLKLNGFEFPEGCPLMIQFMGSPDVASPPLMAPAASSQQAYNPYSNFDSTTCSVQIPPPQSLAPEGSEVRERLFVILTHPLPQNIIQDVFCRFGQLINFYCIKGKNYGFAKYADAECAKKAMETLHGQLICGEKVKVVIADPENSPGNKRMKLN